MATKKYKYINKFKVGCDPEFILLDSKGLNVNVESLAREPFGSDHGGRVAEIHPTPAISSYLVVRRMKKIFDEAPERARAVAVWKAGGIGKYFTETYDWDGRVKRQQHAQPLGGHLHFDIPVKEPDYMDDLDNVWDENAATPNKELLNIEKKVSTLDRYTDWLERLDILPTLETSQRRALGSYGKWGDFRPSNDGGHLEYRTMCSWLYSPMAAMLALTGGKICVAKPDVAKEFLESNIPSRKKLRSFFENVQTLDDDAKRLVENFKFEVFKVDPDKDFRPEWKELNL